MKRLLCQCNISPTTIHNDIICISHKCKHYNSRTTHPYQIKRRRHLLSNNIVPWRIYTFCIPLSTIHSEWGKTHLKPHGTQVNWLQRFHKRSQNELIVLHVLIDIIYYNNVTDRLPDMNRNIVSCEYYAWDVIDDQSFLDGDCFVPSSLSPVMA
jgi:hypothetical protein